jgi:tetratricopeptide (TPR) repeat protein
MKTSERHDLKHNELAETLQSTYHRLEQNRRNFTIAGGIVLAVLAGWGVYAFYTSQRDARAGAMLAEALVISEAQVVPPVAPADGQPAPPPTPNSYPTERARLEAALPKFMAAADTYPNTDAGIAARYQAASVLASLGKTAEARQQFQRVVDLDGRALHGRMARLAVAELDVKAGQHDAAIKTLQELSLDARGDLPIDAILVQLAQAYAAAGKKAEAQTALQRVTTEFATSPYAADARKQLEALKTGA